MNKKRKHLLFSVEVKEEKIQLFLKIQRANQELHNPKNL